MLADGTELGFTMTGVTSRALDSCGACPSSSGAIFQWSPTVTPQQTSTEVKKWQKSATGYLIGVMMGSRGGRFERHLYIDTSPMTSTSANPDPYLAWTKDSKICFGFKATQVSGNRVALMAIGRIGYDRDYGLRPYERKHGERDFSAIMGTTKDLPLDCQFVKVQRLEGWLTGDKGNSIDDIFTREHQ